MKPRSAKRSSVARVGDTAELRARLERAEQSLEFARAESADIREQQRATSEILKVMSGSPADVQPVFNAIVRNAVRLGDAQLGTLFRLDGEMIHVEAHCNLNAEAEEVFARDFPQPIGDGSPYGRAMLQGKVVNMPDLEQFAFSEASRQRGRVLGTRAVLAVPMLGKQRVLGAVVIGRRAAGAFPDSCVALLKTFADQAVIAIDNVRLFNETKQALEQQTATAEILQTMSRSLTDLAPVFDTILRNTIRLCEGDVAALWRFDGRYLRFAAHRGGSEQGTAYLREHSLELGDYNPTPQAGLERRAVHVVDVFAEPRYRPLVPAGMFNTVPNSGTVLALPLLREDKLLGVITIWRFEKRMFNDKQIAMVNTFAAQAVIAIENVRLFNETREALEKQTAIGEVLKVMSASQSDVQPVFESICRSASRLCHSLFGAVHRYDGEQLYLVAHHNFPARALALMQRMYPMRPSRSQLSGRAVLSGEVQRAADLLQDPDYPSELAEHGWRRLLTVPMMRNGIPLGAISVGWHDPGVISDSQVELLRTFADQAVIAIENVRLFNETKEALERQTATAEILKVIASSPSDVQPVFDAVVKQAGRLAGGCSVNVSRLVGEHLHLAAYTPVSAAADETLKNAFPVHIDDVRTIAEAVRRKTSFFVSDFETDPHVSPRSRELMRARGFRSTLYVPILHGHVVHGLMHVSKVEPGPFSPHWIQLLETFGDQVVIAIENVRLFNETKEALERQTATAEILRAISSAPTDTQPVFEAIVQSALRVFSGTGVGIALVQGDRIRIVSAGGTLGPMATRVDMPLSDASTTGAAIVHRTVVNTRDTEAPDAPMYARDNGRALGFRSIAAAPMLREGAAIGAIGVTLGDVGGLSDRHLDLLKTFADQAVIAIENVRLFNETREALEQQTATAEILRVISSSPTDLAPVFDAILKSATALCEAHFGMLNLYDGTRFRTVAQTGAPPEFAKWVLERGPYVPDAGGILVQVAAQRCPAQIADVKESASYRAGLRNSVKFVELAGARTFLAVPLLKDGSVVGAICIYRREVRLFTEKQIALLSTFARQAVIAIDNVRLFNETKEALDQQQASAEVLRVMSSSVADTKPVFQAILESCERLFEGRYIGIALVGEDGNLHLTAYRGPHAAEVQAHFPVPVSMDSAGGAAILTRSVQHYADIRDGHDVPAYARRAAEITGHRSVLMAPMLWEGRGIGTIYVCRDLPGAFSEKEIGLLKTFADQAVIAIQNARLFSETKEALERQTATSEVLKVISQTRIDLQPVLETVLDNARRLCDADRVLILRPDGKGSFVPVAVRIANEASTNVDALTERPIQLDRSTAMGRALLEGRAVHIPDVLADPDYTRRDLAFSGGFRTALSVPMLREGEPIGAMTLTRAGPPRPFTQKQIELVTTFADQAVIAIENVRLFNETTEALEQLRASAEILRVISGSVADVQPVFDTILESCERLFAGRYIGICLVGDDRMIHLTAYHGLRADELKAHFPVPLSMDSAGGAAILTRSVQHYPDLPSDLGAPQYARKAAAVTGYRSVIMAPMIWEEQGIGTIFVARETAGAFTDKEIALLTTFADQAVIAIQNARLFREINEKSRQLEVANRHKSEFLANMSHELRTPLNAIIGFTRIVMRRSKEQLESKQYENLEKILSSGQHLLQLINAILDLSKVEAGRVEVTAAEVALAPVLEQCVKTVEPLVRAPAVRLLRDFDGGLPQVYQDEEKLRQIVINLLSNAVKFTERGTVRVRARANGESFAVAVADTGIGIPADKLEHVFDEFAQADASSTRVYGGTGLGLTIARRLARLMGGDISVESAPGAGSTFTLTLPVRYRA